MAGIINIERINKKIVFRGKMMRIDCASNIISGFLEDEIKQGTIPGAVLGIIKKNEVIMAKAFGYAQVEPVCRKMSVDTIFDLASLTKVIATTTAVMQLIEQGKINLWDYLKEFFPELPTDKEAITVFHLLTHSSGFQAIVRLWDQDLTPEKKIAYILNLPLEYPSGEKVVYSDPNFILLGELVKRVSGSSLDLYCHDHIFQPLGMNWTAFNPIDNLRVEVTDLAATERCQWRKEILVGKVHDENCASMNGVSGHAGLFSNIKDLMAFGMMLLNKGRYQGARVLHDKTIDLMTRDWTAMLATHRCLGWDLSNNYRSSGGVLLSPAAYGHTGFTGTSLWIDPQAKLGVIFLSNRVHPSRENTQIITLRPRLHNLIVANLC